MAGVYQSSETIYVVSDNIVNHYNQLIGDSVATYKNVYWSSSSIDNWMVSKKISPKQIMDTPQ